MKESYPIELPTQPEITPIIDLAEKLGFIEDIEMLELRMNIVSMLLRNEEYIATKIKYETLAENMINRYQEKQDRFIGAQIGGIIMQAIMYFTGNRLNKFGVQVNDAIKLADKMKAYDLGDKIQELFGNLVKDHPAYKE